MAAEGGYYLNMAHGLHDLDAMSAPHLVKRALDLLTERLPPSWRLDTAPVDSKIDAAADLTAPSGERVRLIIEVRTTVTPRDVAALRQRLAAAARSTDIPVVLAPFLSNSTRQQITAAGLSYIDSTGNMAIRVDKPALFLADRGADADPRRRAGRPRSSLNGEPAAKVVRALLDSPGPWRITELMDKSGTASGSVYRVIEFLEAEALVNRDQGLLSVPDWRALLLRWSEDYQPLRDNVVTRWIAPRGLEKFLDQVGKTSDADYAITDSIAAATWNSYAPARSAIVYTPDPTRMAERWGLRSTESGVNVLLLEPSYRVVFERSQLTDQGLRVVAPTQAAVDLLSGPGRSPNEGEELLRWMSDHESVWRRAF